MYRMRNELFYTAHFYQPSLKPCMISFGNIAEDFSVVEVVSGIWLFVVTINVLLKSGTICLRPTVFKLAMETVGRVSDANIFSHVNPVCVLTARDLQYFSKDTEIC